MSYLQAIKHSKSSHCQDFFIYEKFGKYWKNTDCLFIDVGAKDGIKASNTYFFEYYLGWNGICFEPNPLSFFQCEKNRKGLVYPIGISKKEGPRDFFCNLTTPGASGIIENYHPEHGSYADYLKYKSSSNIIQIETVPLQKVLDLHGYTQINLLDVDTEGGELEILQTIDYKRVQIDVINVENLFSKEPIRKYLRGKGFELFHEFPWDDLFVHRTFLHAT